MYEIKGKKAVYPFSEDLLVSTGMPKEYIEVFFGSEGLDGHGKRDIENAINTLPDAYSTLLEDAVALYSKGDSETAHKKLLDFVNLERPEDDLFIEVLREDQRPAGQALYHLLNIIPHIGS